MPNPISAEAVKKMICYYYLVSFCPPEYVSDLKKASKGLRTGLAKDSGSKMKDFTASAVPEVAWRIVAYHQATREPEGEAVKELTKKMKVADSKPEKAAGFQTTLQEISEHPGRAKPDKRLHRQKGCKYCAAPCRHGFFTLVSEPDFTALRAMLDAENQKDPSQRDAVNVLWTYTTGHLWNVLGVNEGFISADHLGNLSYCLLMLATAKSRFALPEQQLLKFQEMNQRSIQNWRPTQINVVQEA